MSKFIGIILMLLLPLNKVAAQNKVQFKIDSLKNELSIAKDDSAKVRLSAKICETYWSINPPEGLPYAHQSLQLAQMMKWEEKMADAYGMLGMNHVILSNSDSAVIYLTKSLELAQKLENYKQIALASGTLGNVFYFQSKFPEAIEYYLKSVTAFEKCNDTINAAGSVSNIGAIYLELNDLDHALPYFEKALKMNEQSHFKIYEAVNLSNIGAVHGMRGDHKTSLAYYLRALQVNKEINELPNIASAMNGIGNTYNELGNLDSAYYFASEGLKLALEVQVRSEIAYSYLTLANVLFKAASTNNENFIDKNFSGNKNACIQQAKSYADSSIQIYLSINNQENLAKAYLVQSKILKTLGDYKGALESYQLYNASHDSVFNSDVNKKLTQKAMQYDFDKKEAKAREEQEIKDIRNKNIRNSIAAGLVGAIIFSIVVFRQRNKINKEKKRSEELLLNILPAEVAEELKAKGSAEAKQIDNVTVLFTDFKDFTQLSEKLSPKELVAEIDFLFRAFDHIMHKYNIEKIKTIGDSYMCAGGLPVPNTTHPFDVVNAALEIQKFMHDQKIEREAAGKLFFEMRIGIHTGPVVAGIVGVKKFAYDIWGDTVNIASRMESSGEAGKINISGTTYEIVKDHFNCIHRGRISAKNKGEIEMYFINHSFSEG